MFGFSHACIRSSKEGYHLVSFDLLSLKTVERIRFWAEDEVEGDYLNVSEMPFFDDKGLWNTLRLGRKFSKPSPMFVRRFYAKHNPHLKSLQHFCKTPDFRPRFKSSFMNLEAMISVYNTGVMPKIKRLF